METPIQCAVEDKCMHDPRCDNAINCSEFRELDYIHQIEGMDHHIHQLEERVTALESIVTQVNEAMEQAKKNPMVANMLKMMGM